MSLKMCRVCMVNGSNYSKLGTGKDSYASKLNYCVPELDLTLVKSPMICQTCLAMVETAYKLRKKCMITEKALKARILATNAELHKNGVKINSLSLSKSTDVSSGDSVINVSDTENILNSDVDEEAPATVQLDSIKKESTSEPDEASDNLVINPESINTRLLTQPQNVVHIKEEVSDGDYDMDDEPDIKVEASEQSDENPLSDSYPATRQRRSSQRHSGNVKNNFYNMLGKNSKGNIVKCLKCNRLFKNRGNLKTHMRVHNKYKCEKCFIWVDCKVKLEEHMNEHSKESANPNDKDRFLNGLELNANTSDGEGNKCKICFKLFPDKDQLILHEKEHVVCDICEDLFESEAALLSHTKQHLEVEDKNLFQCNICGQFFTQENYLLNHRCIVSPEACFIPEVKPNVLDLQQPAEQSFPCEVCGKIFPTKNRYNIHKRCHSDILFFCKICNKPYKTKDSLLFHERSHSRPKEKLHMCDTCNLFFESKALLKNHKFIVHSEEEFYKCSVCSKEFAVKQRLEIHMRVHTGEKPYQCDLCGKCFQIKGSLQVHKKIHTNDKPFQCHNCGKRFITKGNLLMHSRVHTGERPFSCGFCDRRFTVKNTMIVHMRNKHKNEPLDMDFMSDFGDSFHDRLYEKFEAVYGEQCEDEVANNSNENVSEDVQEDREDNADDKPSIDNIAINVEDSINVEVIEKMTDN